MSLVFSIPGKTFLAGEYLALHEGPSLVFLSQPQFELRVQKGTGKHTSFHSESPAGLFIDKHPDFFAEFDLEFFDPLKGKGGMGASTAQFLSLYALWLSKEVPQQDMEKLFDYKHLLEAYYSCAWQGQGLRPSGHDLLGQLKGSFSFIDKSKGLISVKGWPFEDLEMHLLHTGNKIATHEHLKDLKSFSSADLLKSFEMIKDSFDEGASKNLIAGIQSYAQALQELNFTCAQTLELLQNLYNLPGVLAAKGCGALGADVVLVLTQKNNSAALSEYCSTHGLSLLASDKDMSLGLQVKGHL